MKKIIILIVLCLGVNVFSMSTIDGLYCSVFAINLEMQEKKTNDLTKEDYKEAKKCGSQFLISEIILKEKKIIELSDKELKYILNHSKPNIFYERLLEEKDILSEELKQKIKKNTAGFFLEAWGIKL